MDISSSIVSASPCTLLPEGDYISSNLESTLPDFAFPHLIKGNVSDSSWPYLRREIPHNWYVDSRNPTVGFVSRDEASILYNTAVMFKGKDCLEIGCWRGWSTVHLALGSRTLDVIDPVLADPNFASDVKAACARADVLDCITFFAASSPSAVHAVAHAAAKKWSLIFIDGDHDGDGPLRDAEVVAQHAADNAMVLFHDLASPHVTAGLDYFRRQGWQTRVYQTMQIMGVAWRGDVQPVDHKPDASITWDLPDHLSGYEVSGWPESSSITLARPQKIQSRRDLQLERDEALTHAAGLQLERDEALTHAKDLQRDFTALAERIPGLLDTIQKSTAHADKAERDLAVLLPRMQCFTNATQQSALLRRQLNAAEAECDKLQAALIEAEALATWAADAQNQRHVAARALAEWMNNTWVLLGLLRRQGHVRVSIMRKQAELLGLHDFVTPTFGHWLCRRRSLLGLLRRSSLSRICIVITILLDEDRGWSRDLIAPLAVRLDGSPSGSNALPSKIDQLTCDKQALQRKYNALEQSKVNDEAALLDARIELATLREASRRDSLMTKTTCG